MLEGFRKHKKIFVGVIIGPLIIAFAMFYGWSTMGGANNGVKKPVMTIGENQIPLREYHEALRDLETRYKNLNAQFKLSQDQKAYYALSELIDRYYMVQAQIVNQVPVSDQIAREQIVSFMGPENFQQRYQMLLKNIKMSDQEFVTMLANQARSRVMGSMLQYSGLASAADVNDSILKEKEKREMKFVVFSAEDYASKVNVTPEAVNKYYEDHSADFMTQKQFEIQYLEILHSDFVEQVDPSEDKIQSAYEANLNLYKVEESRKLKQIFMAVNEEKMSDPEIEAIKKKMESIRTEALDGKDFGTLAAKFSEGPEKEKQGDIGEAAKNRFPGYGDELFALKKGAVSKVFKSYNGFYLYKVEGVLQERTRELKEVRDSLVMSLKFKESKALAEKKAEAITGTPLTTLDDLKKYAKDNKLELKTSSLFTGKQIPGLGYSNSIFEQINGDMAIAKGELGSVDKSFTGKSLIYALSDVKEPVLKPLEEVKSEVITSMKNVGSQKMAKEAAQEFSAKVKGKAANFKNIAAEYAKDIQSSGALSFYDRKIEGIGSSASDIVKYLFVAKSNQVGSMMELQDQKTKEVNRYCVWYCSKITAPSKEELKKGWGKAFGYASNFYGNSFRYAMMMDMQEKYPVKWHEKLYMDLYQKMNNK